MEFKFDIPDSLFEGPIKDAVARTIHSVVHQEVQKQVAKYRTDIEKAVDIHLSKRLTNERIKTEIDNAVTRIINDRLEDGL